MQKEIAVVGAGLTGLALSIYLARRGYQVGVYDQRPDPRMSYYKYSQGRSMSLDLSVRGLTALTVIGLDQGALSHTVPMKNRIIHLPNGHLLSLKYDTSEKHNINAISRSELHRYLLTEAEKYVSIKIHFNQKFMDVDVNSDKITFMDEVEKTNYQISPFILIGCDGANSKVRKCIERVLNMSFQINHFNYQYKELTIPADCHHLEFQAMHMWPRKNCMLVAQPNYNGSFTCALLLPVEGKYSFQTLMSQPEKEIYLFFKEQFGDICDFIPNFVNEMLNNPVGSLMTISEGQWSLKNKILLMGDSAHAMVPFLGQGMNACFEDCYTLNQYLDKYQDDWDKVIPEFEKNRKIDTNAISTMSLENYPELVNPDWQYFILHREIEDFLSKNFSDIYTSYHNLVCFRLVPYSYANAVRTLQKELIVKIASIIESIDELKKETIQDEIEEYKIKKDRLNTEIC